MFERLVNLIKAMLNQGISKMETPELLAEQAQEQLESSLKKVKESITSALTTEKMLEQQLQKNKEEIATWEKRAAVAVQNNNDEVAKQCLQKRQELNQAAQSLQAQLEEQKKTTQALKARHSELEQEYREFQTKKKNLVARAQAGDAVSKANELLSAPGGSSMDKWEQKIREKEARSAAIHEMSGGPTEDKFKEMDKNIQLDDELAALKAQMNMPKLIVDSEKKEIVDENVPMVVEDITDKKKGDS